MSILRRFIILSSVIFVLFFSGCVHENKAIPTFSNHDHYAISKAYSKTYMPLDAADVQAPSAYVMNFDTGDILLDMNSNQSLPVASISKIMTELLVLEALESGALTWEEEVPISEYAYTISNTLGIDKIPFEAGETYTVRELFEIMAIRSSNGATIALAEAVAGSEHQFVQLMNERAVALNLTNSRFVNSTGLTNVSIKYFDPIGELSDSNHMSAKDIVTLAGYLIDHHAELLDMTSQPGVDFRGEMYSSTNLMLPNVIIDVPNFPTDIDVTFSGVDGFKTGYTTKAGYCFVGTTVMNDIRFISVILGTESMADRFIQTKNLYTELANQHEGQYKMATTQQ